MIGRKTLLVPVIALVAAVFICLPVRAASTRLVTRVPDHAELSVRMDGGNGVLLVDGREAKNGDVVSVPRLTPVRVEASPGIGLDPVLVLLNGEPLPGLPCEVTVSFNTELFVEWETALWGDANGDGKINSQDIIRLKNYLANYDYDTGTSTYVLGPGADANGDGRINTLDVIRLKNYLANFDYDTGTSTYTLGPVA